MLDTIPVPADSKFGAMVARRLNASRPIAPAGSLAMSGPTGTGFSAPPQNLRDRRVAVADDKSCFRLEKCGADGGGETVTQLVVVDCYYMAAGVMHKAEDTNVSSLLDEDDEDAGGSDDEDSGDDADSGKILYFSLTDGGETFGTVPADELNDLMIDETKYVVPLYLFGSDGEVKVDLRTAQKLQVWDDAAGNADEEDAE